MTDTYMPFSIAIYNYIRGKATTILAAMGTMLSFLNNSNRILRKSAILLCVMKAGTKRL
jgi:hypothetical protein